MPEGRTGKVSEDAVLCCAPPFWGLRILLTNPVVLRDSPSSRLGFTLLELIFVTTLIGVLVSINAPRMQTVLDRARMAKAIGDLNSLSWNITEFELTEGYFPSSLAELGMAGFRDPWGNPYQYLRIKEPGGAKGSKGKGKMRKDRFLVPINSDFDLYSMGPDGKSVSPLTAAASQDDIIRANDGGYIGPADLY